MEQYQQPVTPTPAEQPRRRRSRTEATAPDMPEAAAGVQYATEQPARIPSACEPSAEQPRVTIAPEAVEPSTEDPLYLARAGYAPEQRTRHMPAVDPAMMYADRQPVQAAANHGNAVSANGATSMESRFDGKLSQQIGNTILCFLVTLLTLGLCFPWAVCRMYRWRAKHTVIEGRRLVFTGKASQLFGKWLLWLLLTIVTLGIYAFWVSIALEKWRVKHTRFAR